MEFLALAWPSSGCYSHLENESVNWRFVPPSLPCFLSSFFPFILFERQSDREEETEISSVCWFAPPNGHNGRGQAKLELGTLFWSPTWFAWAQVLGPSSIGFPGTLTSSWIGISASAMGCRYLRQKLNPLHHNAGPCSVFHINRLTKYR